MCARACVCVCVCVCVHMTCKKKKNSLILLGNGVVWANEKKKKVVWQDL
jgi:hypothetical protein